MSEMGDIVAARSGSGAGKTKIGWGTWGLPPCPGLGQPIFANKAPRNLKLCDMVGLSCQGNAAAVVSSNYDSSAEMGTLLTVGEQTLNYGELTAALRRYGMLPSLIKELVVDQAIAEVTLTPEMAEKAIERFMVVHQLRSEDQCKTYLSQRGLAPDSLPTLARRELRLHHFKQDTWNSKVESYFLQRKTRLDRVLYSMIRTKEAGLAQELYFRIQDDGQPFADLAREFSEGQEAQTGGLIGPVELSVPHANLGRMLSISKPGQLWPPTRMNNWFVIVRLEKFLPAKLDDPTRQRMIDELYNTWLMEQVKGVMQQIDDPPGDASQDDASQNDGPPMPPTPQPEA